MTQRFLLPRFLLPVLPLCLLLLSPKAAQAQGCLHTDGHAEHQGITVDGKQYSCGTHYMTEGFDHEAAIEQTRINAPEVYRMMIEQQKNGVPTPRSTARYDIVLPFFVNDRSNPGQYTTIEAGLAYDGDSILIWVDVRDTGRIRESTIDALAKGIEDEVPDRAYTRDANTGLLYNDIAIFGRPPFDTKYDPSGRVLCSFLLTRIDEGDLTGGVISGYFSPWDQTTNLGSNETNLLYIDAEQALRFQSAAEITNVLGTMAHELQHLINHNRYTGAPSDRSAHFIYNEGLSEVASIRNGFTDRSAANVMSNPNQDSYFERPSNGTDGAALLRAYSRAMLWTHYISERYGDGLLFDLTAAGGVGLEPLGRALATTNISDDPKEIYADFWMANYNGATDAVEDRYHYDFSVLGRTMSRKTETSVPSSPKMIEENLVAYGAYAHRVINQTPGEKGMKVTIGQGQRDYAVRMVKLDEFGGTTVSTMAPGESQTFERFISLGIVVVNLAGDGNNISFTMESVTLGVEDFATAPGALALTDVAPNPMSGTGGISFQMATAGSIGMNLFDITGNQVARLVDDEVFDAGEHRIRFDGSGLVRGVYTLELRNDAGERSVRQIVIIR